MDWFGDVSSFYVTDDDQHVVMNCATEENMATSIKVSKAALRQMLDAKPFHGKPELKQEPTPD